MAFSGMDLLVKKKKPHKFLCGIHVNSKTVHQKLAIRISQKSLQSIDTQLPQETVFTPPT